MTLDTLPLGQEAVITAVGGTGALRLRLLDMGLIPRTTVRVEKIAPLGNTETSVTTYDVYIELTGEVDSRVLGGMNVSGEIQVSSASNALLLTSEALKKDGDHWFVQMQSGEYRQVEIGMMTDSQVQILSGLSEGEIVVY